jgi:hypothetical protein
MQGEALPPARCESEAARERILIPSEPEFPRRASSGLLGLPLVAYTSGRRPSLEVRDAHRLAKSFAATPA